MVVFANYTFQIMYFHLISLTLSMLNVKDILVIARVFFIKILLSCFGSSMGLFLANDNM